MKKKLPPDILRRLEANRKIFKALRNWHYTQIQRLDRMWGNEGTGLLTATPFSQKVSLDRLETTLQQFIDASPAAALHEPKEEQ